MNALPQDKRLHLDGGAICVAACGWAAVVLAWLLHWPAIALTLAAIAGAKLGRSLAEIVAWAKEDYDRRHPDKHTKDGWDAYAVSVGGWLAETPVFVVGLVVLTMQIGGG